MNIFDLFILTIILMGAIVGYFNGFVKTITHVVMIVVTIICAVYFYLPFAELLFPLAPEYGYWQPTAFVIIATFTYLLFYFIFYVLEKDIRPTTHRHIINRLAGILPGAIAAYAIITVMHAMLIMPNSQNILQQAKQSRLAGMQPLESVIGNRIWPLFPGSGTANSSNNKSAVPTNLHNESIVLPFTTKAYRIRVDLEMQMFDLINAERARAGLPRLTQNYELTQLARSYSANMFAKGYFSHYSQDGSGPFQRMQKANIKYASAGENLAMARSLQVAHNALMASPGHRANILQENFGTVGIGILDAGVYGLMITQEFTDE
jgi:uncharacterized protein YkwD